MVHFFHLLTSQQTALGPYKIAFVILIFLLTATILFPFGLAVGDEIVSPQLDGSSRSVSKLGFSDLSCPFFGVDEDTLFVSLYIHTGYALG